MADTLRAVSVLLGNGDGTFAPRTDYETGDHCAAVAVADLDGDGTPDLVAANTGSTPLYIGSLSILLGRGDGTFSPKTDVLTGAGSRPRSVAIGDLDQDGMPDLAVALGGLALFRGNGDGSFGPRYDVGLITSAVDVVIADLDDDGKLDLAAANGFSSGAGGVVSVLLGHGDGTFGPRIDYGAAQGPGSLAIGDLDGDDLPDVAAANAGANTISVLLNAGVSVVGIPPGCAPQPLLSARIRPTPARGELSIEFTLPRPAAATIRIYDTKGRLVRTLGEGAFSAGEHAVRWDRRGDRGVAAPAGIYFIEVRAGRERVTKRAALVR